MIDGEGCITHSNGCSRKIEITNTDRSIIDACAKAYDLLGIEYAITFARSKNLKWKSKWAVVVRKRLEIVKISETIPIQCIVKRERLSAMLQMYSRPLRPTREELIEMYVDRQMSVREIARDRLLAMRL